MKRMNHENILAHKSLLFLASKWNYSHLWARMHNREKANLRSWRWRCQFWRYTFTFFVKIRSSSLSGPFKFIPFIPIQIKKTWAKCLNAFRMSLRMTFSMSLQTVTVWLLSMSHYASPIWERTVGSSQVVLIYVCLYK